MIKHKTPLEKLVLTACIDFLSSSDPGFHKVQTQDGDMLEVRMIDIEQENGYVLALEEDNLGIGLNHIEFAKVEEEKPGRLIVNLFNDNGEQPEEFKLIVKYDEENKKPLISIEGEPYNGVEIEFFGNSVLCINYAISMTALN